MNKLKIILLQTSFISLGIFFAVGIGQVITQITEGSPTQFEWYFNLSVILAGVLCSLPTFVLDIEKIKPFFIRILIHFFLLLALVSLLGWLFEWYHTLVGYLIVILIFILVYVFVWVIMKWYYGKEDKAINSALNSIRDKE